MPLYNNSLVFRDHNQFSVCAHPNAPQSSNTELLVLAYYLLPGLSLRGRRCLFAVDRASHVRLFLGSLCEAYGGNQNRHLEQENDCRCFRGWCMGGQCRVPHSR